MLRSTIKLFVNVNVFCNDGDKKIVTLPVVVFHCKNET